MNPKYKCKCEKEGDEHYCNGYSGGDEILSIAGIYDLCVKCGHQSNCHREVVDKNNWKGLGFDGTPAYP